MYTFGCVICAFIVLFGGLALILTPLFEKWCERKGISLDDSGVEYERE